MVLASSIVRLMLEHDKRSAVRSRERACESFHNFRPHPEEPERSEGVSKDGRESQLAAMVRDGALCAPPHHEAERVGSLILRRILGGGTLRLSRMDWAYAQGLQTVTKVNVPPQKHVFEGRPLGPLA